MHCQLSLTIVGAFSICAACAGNDGNQSADDAGISGDASTAIDARGQDFDAAAPMARLMYVSTGNAQTLAVLRLEVDGTMTQLSGMDVAIGANTGALAYARTDRRLYLGVGSSVATLTLDSAGAPTLVDTSSVGERAATFIGVTADENHIVTPFFGGGNVSVHAVGDAGDYALARTDDENSDVQPHAALRGPGNRFYVPHRDGNTTHWYTVSNVGELTFVDELASANGVGPRHIAFSPDEQYGYVVNEQGDSVTAHSVGGDGSLTAMDTVTTIPSDFPVDNNNCADIHLTPDGAFLYASNRGHDSIAMFSIAGDGSLTSLGQQDTEATPREFDMSPDGRFIVVAGQGSGFLQSYAVEANGTLRTIGGGGRVDVGGDPRWVIID